MHKFCKLVSHCSSSKKSEIPQEFKAVFAYYKSGKSTITISQHVVFPQMVSNPTFPNYYIQQQLCAQVEKIKPGFQERSTSDLQVASGNIMNIYRLLVQGHIGNKDLGLNINSLKSNYHIKKLVQLRESGKFSTKASQIIIDDIIEEKPNDEFENMLKANILETQKLIETGLKIPISFMISKKNVRSKNWLKCLVKKRKAIHSDIIQCLGQTVEEKKTNSFQQFIYNNGYKVEHLFLRPYSRGCPTDLLLNNDGYNLQQVLKILSIIDFEGKIILENTKSFHDNVKFLDETLKKCGYQKKRPGEVDLINQYMIF